MVLPNHKVYFNKFSGLNNHWTFAMETLISMLPESHTNQTNQTKRSTNIIMQMSGVTNWPFHYPNCSELMRGKIAGWFLETITTNIFYLWPFVCWLSNKIENCSTEGANCQNCTWLPRWHALSFNKRTHNNKWQKTCWRKVAKECGFWVCHSSGMTCEDADSGAEQFILELLCRDLR